MKTSFLTFCLMVSFLFLFTKCKKSDAPPTPPAAVNYSPLTAGSTWTYNYTENASPKPSFTLTVTDKDTVVNTRTYKVLTSSDATGDKYFAKSDSDYYRFASFANIGSFDELYLKDNREVNSTWTSLQTFNFPGSPIPLVANFTYLVKEKGISLVVIGNTYKDVIHIKLDVAVALAGGSIGGGDFYYAKGIGLIQNNISVAALSQSFTSQQVLTAYNVK